MRKIIMIGLILILGLCLMAPPVSATIYQPRGCGSILIPPWEPDVPPLCSFTPSATAVCTDEGTSYVHFTWPAETGVLANDFYFPRHPWDVGTPSWNSVDVDSYISAGWTSIDFQTCNYGLTDVVMNHFYTEEDHCLAVATVDVQPCPSSGLVPISATNTVGQTHILTATFVFGNGQPLSDQTVIFSITAGPNAGMTGTAVTNAQGVATWSYSSSSPGTDTIIASWDDQIEQMHLKTNEAHKTWVTGNNIPEFPSTLLPATMIIGFLGAMLLIQRTKEH